MSEPLIGDDGVCGDCGKGYPHKPDCRANNALAALRARVSALESALRRLVHILNDDPLTYEECVMDEALDAARAALAAAPDAPDATGAYPICNVESEVGHHCQRASGHSGEHWDRHGNWWSAPPAASDEYRRGVEDAKRVVREYDEGGSMRHLLNDLDSLAAPPPQGEPTGTACGRCSCGHIDVVHRGRRHGHAVGACSIEGCACTEFSGGTGRKA